MPTKPLSFAVVLLWSACLLLALVLRCLQLTPVERGVCVAVIVVASLGALVVYGILQRRRRPALPEAIAQALGALPAGLHQDTPLILWHLPGEVSAQAVVYDGNAIWLHAPDAEQLVSLAQGVRRWRDRAPDAAVLALAPARGKDLAALSGAAMAWRHALREAKRRAGGGISSWLVLYAPADAAAAPDTEVCWRGILDGAAKRATTLDENLARLIAQAYGTARSPVLSRPAHRDARMAAVIQWAQEELAPAFGQSHSLREERLHGVLIGERAGCDPQSPLARWLAHRNALAPIASPEAGHVVALPLAIVPQLPRIRRLPLPIRTLAHLIALTALAIAAAMQISAVHNIHLLNTLRDDLTEYLSISYSQADAKLKGLNQLKQDREQLLRYAHEGVPWRLGWGMYRGEGLLLPLGQAITGYSPPLPPPAVLTLDSLALFASNTAQLKPDANRSLIGALITITENPDKRVLIAGHTDDTGNPSSNQKLSEVRALAVRDWFVAMSNLPTSHFATQGYGDTRPLVSNNTPENKARNRRVEITLVPDVPAR